MHEFQSLQDVFTEAMAISKQPAAPVATVESEDRLIDHEASKEVALSAGRLMRAYLREAAQDALDDLVCDIACDVVGRELTIEPAGLQRIVAAAIERYRSDTPLCVRTHPDDVVMLDGVTIDVRADNTLSRGDAVLELREGSIDLRLGVRLEQLLEREC